MDLYSPLRKMGHFKLDVADPESHFGHSVETDARYWARQGLMTRGRNWAPQFSPRFGPIVRGDERDTTDAGAHTTLARSSESSGRVYSSMYSTARRFPKQPGEMLGGGVTPGPGAYFDRTSATGLQEKGRASAFSATCKAPLGSVTTDLRMCPSERGGGCPTR